MRPKKFDGVVEAVRFAPDGRIELVRVYERRGATFSDRILLTRAELLERLKARKRFYSGQRVALMAGTFELGEAIKAQGKSGSEVIVTLTTSTGGADNSAKSDVLTGVPLF